MRTIMTGADFRSLPWRLAWAGVLLAGLLSGCNSETETAQGDRPLVAGILMQEDQFFQLIQFGMQQAAKEEGLELRLGNSYGVVDKEAQLVDTYVVQGVDALAIGPISVTASVPALQRAHEQGVPIIVYDGVIKADFPASNIQSDQVSLGSTMGEAAKAYIEQKLGGKARIAMIEALSSSPEVGSQRVRGFRQVIDGMSGVEVVAEQDAWMAPEAANLVESLLGAHPDINVIWASNEGGTVGAVTAVRNMNLAGKVAVFGTDFTEQIADFLLDENGILQAVTGQKAFDIGRQSIKNAVAAMRGDPVEKQVKLPGILYTRERPEEVREFRDTLIRIRTGTTDQQIAEAN